jgi:hypothetical protein
MAETAKNNDDLEGFHMRRLQRRLSAVVAGALLAAALTLPVSASSTPFRDVPAGHWAGAYIQQAVQTGLVKGQSANYFGLGQPMTRAAFTVVLCRLFGWEMQTPAAGSFTDNQDPSAWYYSAVETACANGAVTRQSTLFRPADPITREEMTVALLRALGYTTVAGLDQGLPCPFQDVTSNKGYLTMAYYLGISGGTSATTFSPDRAATREQAVAMLVRVYDRLHAAAPERIGVASASAALKDLSGCTAVAVSGARLTATGAVAAPAAEEITAAQREAIRAGGAKALVKVDGTQASLKAAASVSAAAIAEAAAEYDGVLLDISGLPVGGKTAHTALAAALKQALGDKALYVAVEAPISGGADYGYDYAALSALADRLILRTAPYNKEINGFPTAPQEPLEEIYYAMSRLKGQVDLTRCSLWLSTTGLSWTGDTADGAVTAEKIQELLSDAASNTYYSARYAEAYLSRTARGVRTVVWFHDRRAVAARTRLCAFFDVGGVCLSDLSSVADYQGYSILAGLGA